MMNIQEVKAELYYCYNKAIINVLNVKHLIIFAFNIGQNNSECVDLSVFLCFNMIILFMCFVTTLSRKKNTDL